MVINHNGGGREAFTSRASEAQSFSEPKLYYRQDPIAVIGFANRLPGDSNNPSQLWEFLKRGGIAGNDPPESRFSLNGHYDKSLKPHTIRTPGAMFLENIDPAEFDAGFFNISKTDAIAMDPQQRQLLEVVYEGIENAGITLEQMHGALFGCFVGSYAVDYQDMQFRDPEDRATGITVGAGRAILSNRISHFFNLKGASMTIDTACSGSLVSVDVACRYLQTRQIKGAIVAGANLYLSPDQNQDMGAMRVTSSATGKCHTFDAKADGYCKAEAVNVVILKRLDDAIRDGDPLRAIIRGTSTNSDGWTPGIASPSAEAQAVAIRTAYSAAGITNFNDTGYLECHGTGTLAGDPIEVAAAASVFGPTRPADKPLIIGSIKSNIGHSEPAAGINGLIKAILAVEKGIIPGNPTFIDPNPKIDFEGLKVRATRTAISWPDLPSRIASVNSFGYGGSNAHAVLQDVESFLGEAPKHQVSSFAVDEDDIFANEEITSRPRVLVFSGNDEQSLRSNCQALKKHLMNPSVNIKLTDLAYTLSERRSHHFNRAFLVTRSTTIDESAITFGKKGLNSPRIGFVFTGQGAQWSQMGRSLVMTFPAAKLLLQRLDRALQTLTSPPQWSLLNELFEPRSPEHLRHPEFSQPLVTALQLALLAVFEDWGVRAQSVVGHSSGEIAAACAAGYLTPEEAIKVAFYRGHAAKDLQNESEDNVGMMAVGLGAQEVEEYILDTADSVQIACYNSPNSTTLSGRILDLEKVKSRLQADNHFVRLLQVNLAYHSKFMSKIGEHYENLLEPNIMPLAGSLSTIMFSSVTGRRMEQTPGAAYWKANMISPVKFDQACHEMLSGRGGIDILIEIGPSGALAGPISQIKKGLPNLSMQYMAAAKRGPDSAFPMFDIAGRIFISGGSIDFSKVNRDETFTASLSTIIDLPNYVWNHSAKYWHESDASKDWRYRPFVHHDLLGSKILGSPWYAPTFKKILDLKDVPWLKDHKMGSEIIFPASGYIAMAIEALYQSSQMTNPVVGISSVDQLRYRLRNVKFDKALVLEENVDAKIMLTLSAHPGTKDSWFDFKVSSSRDGTRNDHCLGLIRVESATVEGTSQERLGPLKYPTTGHSWYKALTDAGYGFGPLFQKQLSVESVSGKHESRSLVSLSEPASTWLPQSLYPIHPTCLDGCFQTVTPSLWAGDRSAINAVLVPAMVDNLVINPMNTRPTLGVSLASSEYTGRGRPEETKNYFSSCSVYDPNTGALLLQLTGLRYHKLDTGKAAHDAHTYNCSVWNPDITFLSQEQVPTLKGDDSFSRLHRIIDLIAHKRPTLRVMEINSNLGDTSSLWFEGGDRSSRAAYEKYSFGSLDPKAVVAAQTKYLAQRNATFSFFDMTKPDLAPSEMEFDLVIFKQSTISKEIIVPVAENIRGLLSHGGYALFVEQGLPSRDFGSDTNGFSVMNSDGPLDQVRLASITNGTGLCNSIQIFCDSVNLAFLAAARFPGSEPSEAAAQDLTVAYLAKGTHMSLAMRFALQKSGWQITEDSYPFPSVGPKSTVLILDELFAPVLTNVLEQQWHAIKHLIAQGCKILWVTSGSQLDVTTPDNALVHGLFRTIRAEDRNANITTLDVESRESQASISAIDKVLAFLKEPVPKTQIESEFVERAGIIYVNRILPDSSVNQVKNDEISGAEPIVMSLHDLNTVAMLRADRVGTLDELKYSQITATEVPIKDNNVEVEIYAAGLNFKDVAVTMGIVPENEHLLGLEGAGIVRRVGKGASNYRVGDRVAVLRNGTFANRIQVPVERTHHIPDSLSFEEAATIPLVYLTSIYSLFHVGNLKKGQSVLIHSAAGGIGISCIQLAQYMGAEIYVTVGTEDKRKFLSETFSIPLERIFSSRTTKFASEIMEATQGKGIDVIVNSLTGELLDESWRICADGGTMVEIGKKDIVNRNHVSMEPFDRNCSFRPVDFSYKQITDALIHSLLKDTFNLLQWGHIRPIFPIITYTFDNIPAAFAYMRSGRHIGKIVITNGIDGKVEVPVRPVPRELALRSDVSYLIVGGLKGLCGSLAIHMAQHGAKHLVALSRSGCSDAGSQGVVMNCNALGCQIQEAKADVSNMEDVRRAFRQAIVPIGGIIQGAMVLRDKPFEMMTVEEYHTTISNKVQGTWNLHIAALEQNLSLDFFTLLSSISGVIGQKGQANYAAANVFMDAFATYRKSLGLPANSTDLGVIEDVGYVAQQGGMQKHFDKRQWTGINEGVLRKILSYSIFQQTSPINKASSSQLITGISVPQPNDSELLRDARFSGLFVGDDTGAAANGGSNNGSKDIQALFLLHQSSADPAAVLASAVEVVKKQFVKILRLEAPMEPAKSLSTYGLDSLSAVEFRNWVRLELRAELTLLEITNASSLCSLCEKIIAKIGPPPLSLNTAPKE